MTKKLATCKILLQLVYTLFHMVTCYFPLKEKGFPTSAFKIKQNLRTVCQFFHDLCLTSGARPYLFSNLTMYLQSFSSTSGPFRNLGLFTHFSFWFPCWPSYAVAAYPSKFISSTHSLGKCILIVPILHILPSFCLFLCLVKTVPQTCSMKLIILLDLPVWLSPELMPWEQGVCLYLPIGLLTQRGLINYSYLTLRTVPNVKLS